MSLPSGTAAYKKVDGLLAVSGDQKSVLWSPSGAPPKVRIQISDVTNFQATPAGSKKIMLKVVASQPGSAENVTHLFHFNSSTNAQAEADSMKDILANLISAHKASTETGIPEVNGIPAAMAIASALVSKPKPGAMPWYEDAQLMRDVELQQSLLSKEPPLKQTYMESLRMKPDTMSDPQFNTQFWSSRINLLRSHAVEINQIRGQYNVLSSVKPRTVDGELKLNISKEQIQLIFDQHPLVKRVYDENVPKLNEVAFWSRFFLSRLYKKLKGERILESDGTDPTFDRYLAANIDGNLHERLQSLHIPHTIDLEGNEENQGGAKSGNRKDWTMRPSSTAKVPIVRTLNTLSEKIMSSVAPSDIDPSAPIGTDERTFNELALKDLEEDSEENRIRLNIKEQNQFFSTGDAGLSKEASLYMSQDPVQLISDLKGDMSYGTSKNSSGGLDLGSAIGVKDDSDSEDEAKEAHVGSKLSRDKAQKQILEGIKQRRAQTDDSSHRSGLSESLFARLVLTTQTTNSFLKQFWSAFLSGDPERAEELSGLAVTLERSLYRLQVIADDATKEREDILNAQKQKIRDHFQKTGKKLPWNPKLIEGGEQVVYDMSQPTVSAVRKAIQLYKDALAKEGVDEAAAAA